MKRKVMKVGNSLVVGIPSEFVKKIGVKSGSEAKVLLNPQKCQITYQLSGIRQLSFGDTLFKKGKK